MLGVRMLQAAAASKSYRGVVLADNPIAYWPLQETTGSTAFDVTGNGWNGTYNGVTLGAAGLINEPGQVSADFNGSSSNVSVPNFPRPAATTVSFELWGEIDTTGIHQTAVGVDSPISGNLAALYLKLGDPTNEFTFVLRDTAGTAHSSPKAGSAAGTVYYLVGTYDGTIMRLYKDAVEVATTAATFTISDFSGALTIGCGWFANAKTDFVNGRLAHVAIYDYALSPAQVLAHYNAAQ